MLRNLFLHPGAPHRESCAALMSSDPDGMSHWMACWLTHVARIGGDLEVLARAFLEVYGEPPRGLGYWPPHKLCLKMGRDADY
jgi:hypothetical protein